MFKKSERELEEIRQDKKIFGVFIMIAAVGILIMSMVTAMQISWPRAEAVVVESVLQETPKHSGSSSSSDSDLEPETTEPSKPGYDLKVGYKYSVENKDYEGRGTATSSKNKEELESRMRDDYAVGRKIQISYNPSNPTESRLFPATITMSLMFFLVSIAVGFGGFKLASAKKVEVIEPEDF